MDFNHRFDGQLLRRRDTSGKFSFPYSEYCIDFVQASKCLGSHRPKELEDLNREIFTIIYRMAIGELQSSELVNELLRVLESEETVATVRKHRQFYTMSGENRE
jgi:hypothetical protein